MSIPGCFGIEGVCSVGFWEETLFLFCVGWEEKTSRSMEFELCPPPCRVFKQTKIYVFMFCIECFGGDQNPGRVEWVPGH